MYVSAAILSYAQRTAATFAIKSKPLLQMKQLFKLYVDHVLASSTYIVSQYKYALRAYLLRFRKD